MQIDEIRQNLESLQESKPLLHLWNLRDHERGYHNLTRLAEDIGVQRLKDLSFPLSRLLPRCPDPDMALNSLERFLSHPDGAELVPVLIEGRSRTLEKVIQLFSTSQYFSDLLAGHPDYLDMLRIPLRRSPSQKELREQLQAEVDAAFEDSAVLRAFVRFRQKQILRIGTNDIIRDRPLEEVTRDLSHVANAALEVALAAALKHVSNRFGQPTTPADSPARCVILAFGKLGGEELNYSSDVDLMFIYDEEGSTRGRRVTSISNDDFYSRVTSEVVRLLTTHTDRGQAYRVDLRLRPEGHRGPLARSLASTLSYYDTLGRTWERQALIKIRPVAGDFGLGEQFVRSIEGFVYRKYLSFAEINEIKALKRRIEKKAARSGSRQTSAPDGTLASSATTTEKEVKTGHGGIRDIEFAIQFLQLLNGGDLPEVRQRNTLLAMQALEKVGCLTAQECHILEDAYRFLRKTEHRLQLMFDLQTHRLPDNEEELRKLALRMGYRRGQKSEVRSQKSEARGHEISSDLCPPTSDLSPVPPVPGPQSPDSDLLINVLKPDARSLDLGDRSRAEPLTAFLEDYREKTRLNRKILDHLLHQTFQEENGQTEPESDLMLQPAPDAETIRSVLERYPFRDLQVAYHNLNQLATENVPFLSTRRCRQFLASIAPRLLRALADTPDPDMALVNLEKVTASLGAKGVLWELFSFNPPSLKLYVELCAASQYLSEILITNPGMIDELLDSLVLNQPRTALELKMELTELCRGAADPEPILHSFQDKEILRIGVRDILGKDTIKQTTAALSELAETILVQIAILQEPRLYKRFGVPYLNQESGVRNQESGKGTSLSPDSSLRASRYVILGLGKLGGKELSYHSDLDLILVYEGDGRTGPPPGASRHDRFDQTDNFHFFTELTQRIIKMTSFLGPMGRLYQVDMRLRPTGKSGSLVIPHTEFARYYELGDQEGGAQLWERQALTRARVVFGDAEFGRAVMEVVTRGAYGLEWTPAIADEILDMRERLEASRSERDLKRGIGGIVDVEFLVQLFQLKYGRFVPALQAPNTWEALEALRSTGLLSREDQAALETNYSYLRLVESRLRIVHNRSLNELPEGHEALEKLARRLGCEPFFGTSAADRFLADLERITQQTREVFDRLVAKERNLTADHLNPGRR